MSCWVGSCFGEDTAGRRGGPGMVFSRCRPRAGMALEKSRSAIRPKSWTAGGLSARTSAQERTLEAKLEGRGRTHLGSEHGPEMFERVQQRIGPDGGRRRLFAAELHTPIIQPPAQFAPEAIHRLQRKRQAQFFRRRLGAKTGQEFDQPWPHQRGRQGMTRQNFSPQNGKRPSATAALPATGTKHPLAARRLAAGLGGIVAP